MAKTKLTWKDADQFGLSPDDRCDQCGDKFTQEPIRDQSLSGRNKSYCSKACYEAAQPKLWFLTVDWCEQSRRGIFCSKSGNTFSRVIQPLGEDEAYTILGPFALILAPRWELLTPEEVAKHNQWRPLAEFRGEYGIARQE